ncbi:MAG: efflux RND transporter permease subunit [Bacteroidales bacterium]|nr:efflux RND transporter permease subunit [Bacteroidales bacterium]
MTKFIIKFRWLIISLSVVTGITMGLLIPSSETDPEIRNAIPAHMPSRIETDKIENEFGVQDMVMLLFTDSMVLTADNLKLLKEIDRDISKLSGVTNRISPFTVKTIKNTGDMMVADPLIRRIPSDEESVELLKEDILSNKFARDIVVSSDFTAASITATINTSERESVTLGKIDSLVSAHNADDKVLKGGLPYIRRHIMKDVKHDGVYLVPMALIIMLIVLKLSLGQWKNVFMPFSVVLLSTFISMGLIPLLGWKLSILSLLAPIILIAVANNYGIYLVARYQELRLRDDISTNEDLIRKILKSLNMPILFSGLTTVAGILGLLTHSIIPAKQGGVLAATGVSAALLMSLTYIPALIWLRGKNGKGIQPERNTAKGFRKLLESLSSLVVGHPGKVIAVLVSLTIIMSAGMLLLKTETNQEFFFPKKSPVRIASNLINEKFGGSQTISVMVSGDIKDPLVMQGIDRLTREVEASKGVGQVFSISQAVREMSKAIYSVDEAGYDDIPGSRESIAQMFELYNMSGDPDDFSQMMNLENTKAHILIKLSDPSHQVIKSVRTRIEEISSELPAEVTIGGYAIIMADMAQSLIKGQVYSLAFALVTVLLLLIIIFRSFRGGLIGIIPLASSVLILFGFMGFAGIKIDSATALLSSIMIGMGVDFTIQYIWCFNSHRSRGLSVEDATRASIGNIGRSIIINAFTVMAGFFPLVFSGFMSIRFFGYLVIISIGSCLIGALLLVPAIIMKFRPAFLDKDFAKTKIRKYEKRNHNINVSTAAFSRLRPAAGCRPDTEQIA